VSASLTELIPELQPFARDLVDAAGVAGLQPRVTSTRRTYAEQKRLYDRSLAGLSPYPAAPPGHSAHEYGWAFDMIVAPLSALADVGAYWEQNGGVWGGRIGDDVHFEFPGFQDAVGPTIRTAQALDDQSNAKYDTSDAVLPDLLLGFVTGRLGEFLGGMDLAEALGLTHSETVHLLTHPTAPFLKALRALGLIR
jgi:hypothetical protein